MANKKKGLDAEDLEKLKEIAESGRLNETGSTLYMAFYEFFSEVLKELEADPELAEIKASDPEFESKFGELMDKVSKSFELESVGSSTVEALGWPLDKLNSILWRVTERSTELGVDVANEEDRKAGIQLPVMYSLDFSELDDLEDVSLTKNLDPYDKRVYMAASAYFENGSDRITYQQIYKAMGYKGRAGKSDLEKIHESVSKMSRTRIAVDNKAECGWYNRVRFTYDGALLPMERVTGYVNGQLAESVVHLFREPPLMTFARERNQLTAVSVKLLNSPLSKTNANLQLEDYLISRISHMKNGFPNHKMAFETICEKTDITEKKQKQRAREKIKKLLDYYQKTGFIKGYRLEKNGVLIEL